MCLGLILLGLYSGQEAVSCIEEKRKRKWREVREESKKGRKRTWNTCWQKSSKGTFVLISQ